MGNVFKISKGLDIRLKGEPDTHDIRVYEPDLYAVEPSRFRLFNPRLLVHEGDIVECGTPLVQNKLDERIFLTSPISGTIKNIVRGEKRKLLSIEILSDKQNKKIDFQKEKIEDLTREKIIDKMLKSGLWPLIRQRPYSIIANPDDTPRDIFISAIRSSPLSASDDQFIEKHKNFFQIGINALSKLTMGKINVGIHIEKNDDKLYAEFENIDLHFFRGPHPVGNVGVQIHKISPINKGEKVWFLYPQDVIAIGKLFATGVREISRYVSVAGVGLHKSFMIKIPAESNLESVISGDLRTKNMRVISGDVLTGTNVGFKGNLGFYDTMISVIHEGNDYELLGWLMPGLKKHSASRTFTSFLFPKKRYNINTNYHGGNRAFVFGSQYEDVFPFDILPIYLLKAILAGDIDKMEQLGIYEIAEEDFALCEYVCTSKIEVQEIVRNGIDLMIQELN